MYEEENSMNIKQIIDKHGTEPDQLIAIMMDCQAASENHYLSHEDVRTIAEEMAVPESHVFSVASFYSLLSIEPRGKHIIQICNDIPCYINGSINLVEELQNVLGIQMCETTDDKLFTLEYTSCIGCCEMAPAMQVGDTVYGNLTPAKIKTIVDELRGK